MAEGLRRRGQVAASHSDGDDTSKGKRGISLESFDLYQKVQSEESVQTSTGAGVSIISYILIAYLVMSELYTFFVPKVQEHMLVDPVIEGRLLINFDITFPALHCGEVNLDAMDVAGEQQNGIDHDITKTRLGGDGFPIGSSFSATLKANATEPEPLPAGYCGSCFGAGQEGQCCNTCEEVRAAYADRGWDSTDVLRDSEQCKRDALNPNGASRPGEGCRIAGLMTVNKVAGNFHIAMGETHARGAGHIHQFNPAQILRYNVTHTIHKLSFGQELQVGTDNGRAGKSYGARGPLDGVAQVPLEGAGVYMYYIKVIPTVISKGKDGPNMTTNQYSVTRQYRPAVYHGQRQNVLPGVFFVYDVSPFMVAVTSHTAPLASVVTNLCAILGGVIAAATLVDQVLYRLTKASKGMGSGSGSSSGSLGPGPLGAPVAGGAQGALVDALAGAVTQVHRAAQQYTSPTHGYGYPARPSGPSTGMPSAQSAPGSAGPGMYGQGPSAAGAGSIYASAQVYGAGASPSAGYASPAHAQGYSPTGMHGGVYSGGGDMTASASGSGPSAGGYGVQHESHGYGDVSPATGAQGQGFYSPAGQPASKLA